MALIEWREEYCTGISGVDHEHQELIRQINTVYELIGDDHDRDLVVESLGEIYGNIAAHFALEEQLMQRHAYEHYQQHKADHERLLDEIRDITDEFEAASQLDKADFQEKLSAWFSQHFSTHDAKLHRMDTMQTHQTVSQSTLKSMIQNAKNKLLHKRESHH